ncbi:type I DNA topoisomerase [Anaerorhabdus furcosa]|uniref:DNA topoisomerase 1 n=1 Tax=Anaerorhabdus furcosa TaxID=118967 RepID=A0A1T4NEZ2_9FIRM|nr:type I DNA topoisomerase [Anaerorhabdus furcosa]SJZ77683.1 DNA topoisomerase-1 [Anaerorhabdus furcosa]
MKNLVIVESPSKSKTIEKYLGKDFEVVSSKGHIRDLAIKGKDGLGVDVENDFAPSYSVSKEKKDVVKDLKARAKKVDQVYLATDPDREGEAISWHLAQVLGLDVDDVNRVVFNEITKDAVLGAFDHPRTIDMGLVRSQETRRILDRIIGFKLSKLLKNKIKSKSAGRVQSVALKLIVDREKEIKAFIPEEYWTLDAIFNKDGKEFNASLAKINGKKAELKNEVDAKAAYEACLGEFEITNVKKQVRKKEPKLPFITSTLQQEASTKLGFSAKRTMSIAQRLYEGIELKSSTEGLITYMRTDSTRLSDVFIKAAHEKIVDDFGKDYLGNYKVKNDENSQDAHEGIRPTNLANTPEEVKDYLSAEQYKLYKMIYARALASLMAPAKTNTVAVTLSQNKHDFTANGTELAFDGYLAVYSDYESSKDVILPELNEKETMNAKELKSNQHFTEPPLRYSEARLIKQMEEEGIGRPSTYSMIIDTIQARGYVSLEKSTETSKTKVFFPTEQGELTTEKLDQYFNDIINVKYTAQMESELDGIADGETDYVKSLRDFYNRFEPLVDHAYENMEKIEAEKVGEACPECGNDLVYRVGRFGKFISCSTFPECKYTRKIEQPEKEKPEPSGKMCPECGAELLKRKSRYGNYFLGCSNFPKCKHIENIEGEEAPKFRRKAAKKK